MKGKRFTKEKMRKYGVTTPWHLVSAAIFLVSVCIYLYARNNAVFAEAISRHPTMYIRLAYSKLTSVFPFSVAELFFLSVPAILLILRSYFKKIIDSDDNARYYNTMISVFCIIGLIASYLMVFFGVCYFRKPLEENIGLTRRDVTTENLRDTALSINKEIKKLCPDITFSTYGASHTDLSFSQLNDKLNKAYKSFASKYDFIASADTRVKPVAISDLWIYTHVSGVYTFFTGESNVNTAYPDFVLPYTMAHEMAHQRGIAREEEANFVAFLVCLESEDSYIRYSAYANMLDYVMDALNEADSDMYYEVYRELPAQLQYEYYAFAEFFKKYSKSTASKVTNAVNNTYLQSQGQQAGTKSYGLVVDLAVAYYSENNK